MAKRQGQGAGRHIIRSTQIHGDTAYNRRKAGKEAEQEIDRGLEEREKTYTVLVAEDDDAVRAVIVEALIKDGYDVLVARDGKEALSMYEAYKPDILVTDVTLPEVDGMELTRKIKDIPVIISTANLYFDEENARNAGACDVIGKSYVGGSDELCDAVRNTLKKK